MDILILSLVVLTISLVIAGFLMAKEKALLGIILGALPIALMVFLTRWSIQRSIERCMERVCVSSGLPVGCEMAEFGCNEWPSLGLAFSNIAGVMDLVLYIIGIIVIAVVQFRRN
jgi:hypothetical protein